MKPSLIAKKTPCELLIRQEIERAGPMSFHRFVELALYHPRYGYYNQLGSHRGRTGDYFTSVQVSPVFGQIFSDVFLQMRETLGSDQFALIEIGAGSGEFLEEILKRTKGFKVWAVEKSRPARDALVKRLSRFPRCKVVSSMDEIEWTGTLEGCLFSNEFFDALPFHRFRWRGGEWKEICVGLENGQLMEVEETSKGENGKRKMENGSLAEGHEIEFRPQIPEIFEEWSSRLSRGFVLTVDYGHPRESFFRPTRSNGTWMCYHKHTANKQPFEYIGEQDITAHVDFTQLVEGGQPFGFEPALFCSQGIFLSHIGEKRVQTFLSDTAEAEKRRRAGAVQQLIHPEAMGETFWTLVQSKGIGLPSPFSGVPNRLRRLI